MNEELGIRNSSVKPMAHVTQVPLRIEREYTLQGQEMILIEGVRYDAEYFRTFAHPDTDVLYAVTREEDGVVKLTEVRNRVEAAEFFDKAFGADPEFTWEQVKKRFEGDNEDGL